MSNFYIKSKNIRLNLSFKFKKDLSDRISHTTFFKLY
jgi:hypothetical protein